LQGRKKGKGWALFLVQKREKKKEAHFCTKGPIFKKVDIWTIWGGKGVSLAKPWKRGYRSR